MAARWQRGLPKISHGCPISPLWGATTQWSVAPGAPAGGRLLSPCLHVPLSHIPVAPCPTVPTAPCPSGPLSPRSLVSSAAPKGLTRPASLPTPKMAAGAPAERPRPVLTPPARRSPGFLYKMAAPSGRSDRRLWAALVPAALLCLAVRAAEEPSTADFDVRPGGEVHSFSRSLVRGEEGEGEGEETVRASP